MLSHEEMSYIAQRVGDSFYLFYEDIFRKNIRELSAAMRQYYSQVMIGYSYKTNYTPDVCLAANQEGCLAEVVSEMEYNLARHIGVPADRIIFNGPARTNKSLIMGVAEGAIVNIDSLRDLDVIENAASTWNTAGHALGVRCNFQTTKRDDSRFGLDVNGDEFRQALSRIRRNPKLRLGGLHCHLPDRNLDAVRERARLLILIAAEECREECEFLNFGGGYFGHLPKSLEQKLGTKPPTFLQYAEAIAGQMADHFGGGERSPSLIIEPGTSVVADAFSFVCTAISKKHVRNRNIVTVSGSIFNISPNGRKRNLPVAIITPASSSSKSNNIISGQPSVVDLAGYTCIEGDILSENLSAQIIEGDFVVFNNVGSYSLVMKPPFIQPQAPVVTYDPTTRTIRFIRDGESDWDIFCKFPLYRQNLEAATSAV